MIQVEGVTKRYGTKTAVDNISFEVERGEIVGFLGPNGAGKTTTMRILTGFLPPTLGVASVAGFDIATQPIEAKRRIGYLPESPPIYPEMTVEGYLRFVASIKGIDTKQVSGRVDAAMERTATSDVRDTLAGKLSKGYRQRVGLAQALIHAPEVLILDEPTSGLDPKQIREVRQLIRSLAGEHTILLSTHILPEVAGTCGRVIIINEGRIEASDSLENLTARLEGATELLLDVEGPRADVRPALASDLAVRGLSEQSTQGGRTVWRIDVDKDDHAASRLAAVVVNAGWGLHGLRPVGPSLEDIFLKITSQEAPASEGGDAAEPEAELGGEEPAPAEPDAAENNDADADAAEPAEGSDR